MKTVTNKTEICRSKYPFYQKSIIITGASRGIGRELALLFAEQGAYLTLAARDENLLAQVADICYKNGGKAITVTTDVTKEEQCQALVQRAYEEYGQIDILVNNAGIMDKARFEEIQSLSSGESVMRVNFWGSIYCTYYALPYLKKTKGRIVVMNSGAGKFPTPTSIFYGTSKHALDGFFDTLRLELQTSGITVTSIYPEWIATGFTSRALGAEGKPIDTISTHESGAKTVNQCAKVILKAVEKRKEMAILSSNLKLGYIVRPILRQQADKVACKAFE